MHLFLVIFFTTFGLFGLTTQSSLEKKVPKHDEVIAKLDPLKHKQEPLSVNSDSRFLGESLNAGFLKSFIAMKSNLLPGVPLVHSMKAMRVQEGEYIPRQHELVVQNRLPDCRALYTSFKVESVLKDANNRIYLVKEDVTEKRYVYKVYNSPDEYAREQFVFQITDHPNIMKAVCFHQENISKRPGIVMEYIKGENAIRWASKQSYGKLKDVAAQMLIALDYLHRLGFVHSDYKADNVLIEEGTDRVVLFDFGYTVPIEESRRGLGTRQYEAPELFGHVPGPIKTGIDMWALGMTIVAMANAQVYGESNYKRKILFPMIREKETNTYSVSAVAKGLSLEVRDVVNFLLALDPLEREYVTYRQLQFLSNRAFFKGVNWETHGAQFRNSLFEV